MPVHHRIAAPALVKNETKLLAAPIRIAAAPAMRTLTDVKAGRRSLMVAAHAQTVTALSNPRPRTPGHRR